MGASRPTWTNWVGYRAPARAGFESDEGRARGGDAEAVIRAPPIDILEISDADVEANRASAAVARATARCSALVLRGARTEQEMVNCWAPSTVSVQRRCPGRY